MDTRRDQCDIGGLVEGHRQGWVEERQPGEDSTKRWEMNVLKGRKMRW